ncbi:hypothetical protein B0H11DRAFT_1928050 [Mycena galericulata]|nr:hypothetical protein B0H11DRAFT_1928050 [Mycena galericulata]
MPELKLTGPESTLGKILGGRSAVSTLESKKSYLVEEVTYLRMLRGQSDLCGYFWCTSQYVAYASQHVVFYGGETTDLPTVYGQSDLCRSTCDVDHKTRRRRNMMPSIIAAAQAVGEDPPMVVYAVDDVRRIYGSLELSGRMGGGEHKHKSRKSTRPNLNSAGSASQFAKSARDSSSLIHRMWQILTSILYRSAVSPCEDRKALFAPTLPGSTSEIQHAPSRFDTVLNLFPLGLLVHSNLILQHPGAAGCL